MLVLGLGSSCTTEGPALELVFSDQVVEARARQVVLHRLAGVDCATVLDIPASDVAALAPSSARVRAYPADPTDLLPDGDGGRASLHVAARDSDGWVMARGCAPYLDGPPPEVEMLALPPCDGAPTAADLAVVFDASDVLAAVDPTFGGVANRLGQEVAALRLPPESSFSLVLFGTPTPVEPVFGAAGSDVADALGAVILGGGGEPDLFAAMALTARRLRDRATSCRLPAMVVVAAGVGIGTVPPAEAAFHLYGAQGDAADDLFAYGVALTDPALEAMQLTIVESIGEVRQPLSEAALAAVLAEAGDAILDRLRP